MPASRPVPPPPQPAPARKQQKPAAKAPISRPDTRLFVRISPTHPARAAGSFVVFTGLKGSLGPNAHLLKEVLEVPSGFALCTSSLENLAALQLHTELISNSIADCQVERQ
jgi:hypothetical protein